MNVPRSLVRRVNSDLSPVPPIDDPHEGDFEHLVAANMAEAAAVVRASDGVIVYTNASFDTLFGYARGELDGLPVSTINASVDQTPGERAHEIMQALEHRGAWIGDVHNVRRDGSEFWTEAEIVEVEDPQAGTVWVTVRRDSSDRRDAHDALRASEERFRAAFELSPAPTVLLDASPRILDANEAFCHLTGYSRDELIDKPLADVTHPDDAALDPPFLAGVYRGQRATGARRFVTRDGHVVPATVDADVARSVDGHALYAIATVTR
jgi:PAS domain S-box-containing protein